MRILYCGIDAGSSHCHFVVMDKDGEYVVDTEISTSELHLSAFLDSLQKDDEKVKVHLEAAELSGWIRGIIMERTDIKDVVVSDPKRMSWIAKDPHKKDPIDAYKLAELLRLGRTHPVYYSDDKKMRFFKSQVQYQESLSGEKARIKKKIKAALRRIGIIFKSNEAYSKRRRPEILRSIEETTYRASVEDLYELLDKTQALCRKAEKRLAKAAENWPIIEYFMEVPGVGLILSCRFVAYVQTPCRFATKQKLWTFSRLGLSHRSSDGKQLSAPRLDHNGNGTLKDLSRKVFEGAKKRDDDNAFKRAYYRYLKTTNNEMHARLTVQRKVLTTLWTMWRNNERYDDRRG